MRTIALAVAAGALLAATQANAGSFPVNSLTGAGTGLVDQVAVRVYVHEGHRFCFYFDGWHGPGWYRCGFAHRRGLGWGGVYGWNDWSYGPYERRFHGRVHRGERFGYGEEHERRGRVGIDSSSTRTRDRDRVETRSRTRSTTGSGMESNTRMNRSTTGRGPGADVETHGGAKMQGGTGRMQGGATGSVKGGGNARGGASVGGGAGGGDGDKKQ